MLQLPRGVEGVRVGHGGHGIQQLRLTRPAHRHAEVRLQELFLLNQLWQFVSEINNVVYAAVAVLRAGF